VKPVTIENLVIGLFVRGVLLSSAIAVVILSVAALF
jgi:hypothetical protein